MKIYRTCSDDGDRNCRQINYPAMAWTVIIAIFLLNTLSPECVQLISNMMQGTSELLEVGITQRCCCHHD